MGSQVSDTWWTDGAPPIYKPWSSAIWKGSHNPILRGLAITMVIKPLTNWDDPPSTPINRHCKSPSLVFIPSKWGWFFQLAMLLYRRVECRKNMKMFGRTLFSHLSSLGRFSFMEPKWPLVLKVNPPQNKAKIPIKTGDPIWVKAILWGLERAFEKKNAGVQSLPEMWNFTSTVGRFWGGDFWNFGWNVNAHFGIFSAIMDDCLMISEPSNKRLVYLSDSSYLRPWIAGGYDKNEIWQ